LSVICELQPCHGTVSVIASGVGSTDVGVLGAFVDVCTLHILTGPAVHPISVFAAAVPAAECVDALEKTGAGYRKVTNGGP
jgi:hypothetical protein